MDYLEIAKDYTRQAEACDSGVEYARLHTQIAIAHALIAIAEQMRQNADLAAQVRADAERAAQVEERLALRRAKERIS